MVRIFSLVWLIFVTTLLLCIYIHASKIWPYKIFLEIENFMAGHPEEKTSLTEKIKNDANLGPYRFIRKYDFKKSNLRYRDLHIESLNSRRADPKIFISEKSTEGYRLIHGVFDFKDKLHGVLLIDPNGNIQNTWNITQEDVPWRHLPDTNVTPHGIEINPDGSILFAFDSGTSLTKYDYCGEIIWRLKGGFHHSIDNADNGTFWTWGSLTDEYPYGNNLMNISIKTGEIIKIINIYDVIKVNHDIDIFGIRQFDSSKGYKWVEKGGGALHLNDIEALPEKLNDSFPAFNTGDLLVSLRSVNLIFVMDPATLKVKWWRQGLTRRQHDPDWQPNGKITIFNNNMHRKYSNIIELDLSTFKSKVILDGKNYDFYTWKQGNHQILSNGRIMVTSSEQGRVFEIDSKGDIVFDFINSFDENDRVLPVIEAKFLDKDFFADLPSCN